MIDAHRGAFEFDWRARFGLPLSAVGEAMTYGEALRLVERLLRDPSSHVAASVGEWSHATTREAIVLMDLYDLTHHIAWKQGGGKGSKPKPYPRPWPSRTKRVTKPSLSQEEVFAALREAGHTMPFPAPV